MMTMSVEQVASLNHLEDFRIVQRNADTRVFMLLDELGKPFKVVARKGENSSSHHSSE